MQNLKIALVVELFPLDRLHDLPRFSGVLIQPTVAGLVNT
jgi:hypothetical protein